MIKIDEEQLKSVITKTLSEFGELPIGLFPRFVENVVKRIKEIADDCE